MSAREWFECTCTNCGRNNGRYSQNPNLLKCRYCHSTSVVTQKKSIRQETPPKSKFAEANPSSVTEVYWIHAVSQKGNYPPSTLNSGKWLVFVPPRDVDEVWTKLKKATEEGRLGGSSKVATAKPNPNATSENHVICIYTYDWTDTADVMRIRDELRNLGITAKIPYKSDEDTMIGKYRVRGHTRISKYYE